MPPNEATPTMVFAAEPPEISTPGPITSYSSVARSSSMRVIPPFGMSSRSMKASVSWLSTSTNALPIPTTSMVGAVPESCCTRTR